MLCKCWQVPTHRRDIWTHKSFPKKALTVKRTCGWVDLYSLGIAAHPVRVCQSLESIATPDTYQQGGISYPTPFSVSKVEVEPDSILSGSYLFLCRFFFLLSHFSILPVLYTWEWISFSITGTASYKSRYALYCSSWYNKKCPEFEKWRHSMTWLKSL